MIDQRAADASRSCIRRDGEVADDGASFIRRLDANQSDDAAVFLISVEAEVLRSRIFARDERAASGGVLGFSVNLGQGEEFGYGGFGFPTAQRNDVAND
jgi:hypothetical protein